MDDDAYLQRLLEVLGSRDWGNEAPGLNDEWHVTAMRVVPSDDGFDDVAVTIEGWGTRHEARTLFDRGWRRDAGFERPEDFAVTLLRGIGNPPDDDVDEVEDRLAPGEQAGRGGSCTRCWPGTDGSTRRPTASWSTPTRRCTSTSMPGRGVVSPDPTRQPAARTTSRVGARACWSTSTTR